METKHLLVPPLNFAMVVPGIYRSGFYNARNYRFLKESLGIRSVMYLSTESYTMHQVGQDNVVFMEENGIQMFSCQLGPHKEPFGGTDPEIIASALAILLDVRNHPVLVHDDKGKHRAGVLIGCLRKIQGWSLASIFHEYSLFTRGSVRLIDLQWIEFFSQPIKLEVGYIPKWLQIDSCN